MILAQSHRQLLNGSNFLWLLLCLLILSSCDPTKRITKTPSRDGQVRIYNPDTGLYEWKDKETIKIDTVEWTKVPEENFPPIEKEVPTVIEEVPIEVVEDLRIALMLPLNARVANSGSNLDAKTKRFVHFYAGAKIAIDKLSNSGNTVFLDVYDTEEKSAKLRSILDNGNMENTGLIIGPYNSNNLKATASFGKENDVTVVSPWLPTSTSTTSSNPRFVNINPSLPTHCYALTEHIKKNFTHDQVYLVARNVEKEKNRFKYFNEAAKIIDGSMASPAFKEYVVDDNTPLLEETDINPILSDNRTTVFVMPYYSKRDEAFVYSFLQKVQIARENGESVVVYGFPQLRNFSSIDKDYFENLNIHISATGFHNKSTADVRSFYDHFVNRYGTYPIEDAYEGHDMIMYLVPLYQKYGRAIYKYLPDNYASLLHLNFELRGVYSGSSESLDFANYQENKSLKILEFENFEFQLAN